MPKHFDPTEAEGRLYAAWEAADCFRPDMDEAKPPFSIVIPPPNVTGSLHMGHAVNNTIQDILARFHRMRGYDVLWQPGTDHAGIATQMVVERKLAEEQRPRSSMSREDFLDEVWAWKRESGGIITEQLRRLGASCDWSREKFTLGDPDDPSDKMAEAVTKAFVEMYEAGLIYRDKRLVNWDPHFQTAISDLEVENRDMDGHMWHFKYPLEGRESYTYIEKDADGNVTLSEERDYISIATTRPETMLGDGAVAVHPDDDRYAPIVGKKVRLPLADRLIPIIADDYPDPDFGSGAVKITGAHDFNDHEVAKRHDLPMYALMGTKGEMIASDIMPEKYVGMDRFEARKAVVADIDAEGLLIKVEDKKIMQPFGDRSGAVIEPMLTDQWFVDAEKLAGEAMAAVARGHASPPSAHPDESRDPVDGDGKQPRSRIKSGMSGGKGEGIKPALTSSRSGRLDRPAHLPTTDGSGDGFAPESSPGQAVQVGEGGNEGSTRFIPENWKKTYDHWMENIQPWCISRQLWWGHRIPAWIFASLSGPATETGSEEHKRIILELDQLYDLLTATPFVVGDETELEVKFRKHLDELSIISKVIDVSLKQGPTEVGVYTYLKAQILLRSGSRFTFDYIRDPDVLDTWFSSGLWPFSTLGWPDETEYLEKFYPTSVLVTAFDIIFFWVARMMMQGLYFMDEVPFRDVYIHALVLDEAGKKMSKSIGNTIDPLDLIDGVSVEELVEKRTRGLKNPETAPQVAKATRKAYPDGFEAFGADALRFTLAAMAGQGRNIKLSVDRVAGYRNFGTKLWNAARFAQMNGCRGGGDFDPARVESALNRWIVAKTAEAAATATEYIIAYRFNDAADAVYSFVWGTVCDWYIELAKPDLNGADPEETQATLGWVLDQSFKLLHPFMPFITEELWAQTGDRDGFLMLSDWPEIEPLEVGDDIDWLIRLISALRSVRAEMNVPPSRKAPLVVVGAQDERFETFGEALGRLARVDGVTFAEAAPDGALQTVVDGVSYAIPLDGLIDVDAERKRLDASIAKAEGEVAKIDKKLGNANFTDRAPAAVVQEQKDRRAGYADELAKLSDARAALG
ncbi:valine--tRNA ligase [uncultured Algimonas sp.]|uniref:valine--tRNA ligase n=1 Tax=uncultured Algimonas sp. TaxID=1547920 RepID=UPI0026369A89|nr:valine--tRNA ligase [uncultured Algimonas sp.]